MPFAADELERLGILGERDDGQPPARAALVPQRGEHDPRAPGPGLGTAVLQPVLERCDADGARAYLESSNPRNLTLYRRHGFVDAGEIPLPDGPSLIKMWRDPR